MAESREGMLFLSTLCKHFGNHVQTIPIALPIAFQVDAVGGIVIGKEVESVEDFFVFMKEACEILYANCCIVSRRQFC